MNPTLEKKSFGPELLAIARAGAGFNNIPIEECAERGIVVFNSPGANAEAVKEQEIASLVMASRDMIGAIDWVRTIADKGDEIPEIVEKGKSSFSGPELLGKTLGVIGLGAIGVLVANAAENLGMTVIGYDPYLSVTHALMLSRKVHVTNSLDDLYAASDYVTIHVPENDSTRGTLCADAFAKMKDGVAVLNFARDGLVVNADLKEALESGKVRIYVTDVPNYEVVNMDKVKALRREKDGYELPEALVYMVGNDGTNEKLSVKGDGSFTQVLKPGVDYVFLGTCKGYLNVKNELRIDTSEESVDTALQFPLPPINVPVLIDNIFYEFDKADLTPESTEALDKLVDMMNQNPNITIELSAHCDYRGNDDYNERLSQRRAESVVNYLIAHDVAADRLTPKGYGESLPKVVSKKMVETYKFLTEGDTLTEAFILKHDEHEQEQMNALNRRTEFRVLRTTYGTTLKEYKAEATVKEEKEE